MTHRLRSRDSRLPRRPSTVRCCNRRPSFPNGRSTALQRLGASLRSYPAPPSSCVTGSYSKFGGTPPSRWAPTTARSRRSPHQPGFEFGARSLSTGVHSSTQAEQQRNDRGSNRSPASCSANPTADSHGQSTMTADTPPSTSTKPANCRYCQDDCRVNSKFTRTGLRVEALDGMREANNNFTRSASTRPRHKHALSTVTFPPIWVAATPARTVPRVVAVCRLDGNPTHQCNRRKAKWCAAFRPCKFRIDPEDGCCGALRHTTGRRDYQRCTKLYQHYGRSASQPLRQPADAPARRPCR